MITRNNLCVVFTPGWGLVVGFCEQDNEQFIFISIEIFLSGECIAPRKIYLYEVSLRLCNRPAFLHYP